MKIWAIAILIVSLEVVVGLTTGNLILTCTLLASTFSIGLPILLYWDPSKPPNRVACTYLSMIPGLGYAYLGDWKRSIPLIGLFIISIVGLSFLTLTDTDAEIEYVVMSCMLIMASSICTSIAGAGRGAKERGIESIDRNLEVHLKNEGLAIRVSTLIWSILFIGLCIHYFPVDIRIIGFFASVWMIHVCLNLSLYAYWQPYDVMEDPGRIPRERIVLPLHSMERG